MCSACSLSVRSPRLTHPHICNQIMAHARMQASRDAVSNGLRAQLTQATAKVAAKEEELKAAAARLAQETSKVAEARAHVDELTRGAQRKRDLVEGQDAEHKLTYLKGAMMQYMLTGSSETTQKEALMRVIATILHFSPQETQRIHAAIAEAEAASQSTSLDSVWGMFSTPPSSGGSGGGSGSSRRPG